MKKLKYVVLTVLLLSPLFYFFVGFEYVPVEGDMYYDSFIKKHPSTLSIFRNPVLWGTSDFIEYNQLDDDEMKTNFRNLCYYRYDLTDIKQCENLFRY